jgi:SpoVK/Ycf46/Vps4 family AAA+-type ATPase
MTASVLAGELGLPLFQVRLDGLISRYMGETASKLRLIFDSLENTLWVFFFDEFDAIGADFIMILPSSLKIHSSHTRKKSLEKIMK